MAARKEITIHGEMRTVEVFPPSPIRFSEITKCSRKKCKNPAWHTAESIYCREHTSPNFVPLKKRCDFPECAKRKVDPHSTCGDHTCPQCKESKYSHERYCTSCTCSAHTYMGACAELTIPKAWFCENHVCVKCRYNSKKGPLYCDSCSCRAAFCDQPSMQSGGYCFAHTCPICHGKKQPDDEFCMISYCQKAQCQWGEWCKKNVDTQIIKINIDSEYYCSEHSCRICGPTTARATNQDDCEKHHCNICRKKAPDCGHGCTFPGCKFARRDVRVHIFDDISGNCILSDISESCPYHQCPRCMMKPIPVFIGNNVCEMCDKCLKLCDMLGCKNPHARGTSRCPQLHACSCYGGPNLLGECPHNRDSVNRNKFNWRCQSKTCAVCGFTRKGMQWNIHYMALGLECDSPILEAVYEMGRRR